MFRLRDMWELTCLVVLGLVVYAAVVTALLLLFDAAIRVLGGGNG